MKSEFTKAKEFLESILSIASELEERHDDLLNDTIFEADMLLYMIKRFDLLLVSRT